MKILAIILAVCSIALMVVLPGCAPSEKELSSKNKDIMRCRINGTEYYPETRDWAESIFYGNPYNADISFDSIMSISFNLIEGHILHMDFNLGQRSTFSLPRTYVLQPDTLFRSNVSLHTFKGPNNYCFYELKQGDSFTITITSLDRQAKIAKGTFSGTYSPTNPTIAGSECGSIQVTEGQFSVPLDINM